MLLYKAFYRQRGVRRPDQWRTPMTSPLTAFSTPYNTVVHKLPEALGDDWADPNDLFLKDAPSQIKIETIRKLSATDGRPYPIPMSLGKMISFYRRKYPMIKPVMETKEGFGNAQHIFVQNYGLLDRLWRYRRNVWARWYRWSNFQKTLWENVNRIAELSDRQQFIPLYVPLTVPTKELYARAATRWDRTALNFFPDDAGFFTLELWKWLGEARDTSLIKIETRHLSKVNLLFIESGQFALVNLGTLDSFRVLGAEEVSEDEEDNHIGVKSPAQMQRELVKFFGTLLSVRTVAPKTVTTVQVSDEELESTEEDDVVEVVTPVTDEPETAVDATQAPGTGGTETLLTPVVVSKAKVPTEQQMGITVKPKLAARAELDPSGLAKELGFILTSIKGKDLIGISSSLADNGKIEKILEHKPRREIPPPVPAEEPENELPEVPEEPEIDPTPLEPSQVVLTVPVGISQTAERAVQDGLLSVGEFKRMERLAEAPTKIKNPLGEGSLADLATIPSALTATMENIEIPDIPTVLDKSMLKSTLIDFDKKYITKVLQKDVARNVLSLQEAGIAVTDYQVERVVDAMNAFDSYTVKLAPVAGKPSLVRFRIPAVDKDGTFVVNGTKRRLRKQRGDIPIRKTGPGRVALSSYYGKTFVNRAERSVSDYGKWVINKIQERIYNDELPRIESVHYTYIVDHDAIVPRIYSAIAQRFSGFTIDNMNFQFDYAKRETLYNEADLKKHEVDGRVVCGLLGREFITVDELGDFRVNGRDLGTIENILKIDATKAPVDSAELRVMGKTIPLGIVLGYYMGLGQLLRLLKVRPQRVKRGGRYGLDATKWAMKFNDEVLIFNKKDRLATLILAGFQTYHREIAKLSVYDFEQTDTYTYVMSSYGLTARYSNELSLMLKMFIDPITKECLEAMGEPTRFNDLLIRAAELLLTDAHPPQTRMSYQRLKGYERFSGTVYGELVKSVRQYNGKPMTANSSIDLNPNAVWMAIQQDPSVLLVEESNPIHNLREKENVTFGGTGGRTARSMVRSSRVYDPDDMGVISEATVDNADVGINTYMSADPNLTNLRGMTKRYDPATDGPANLLSTSALISPASVNDDPKRINFINIQHGSGISAKGYTATPLRTGYEQVLAHRVDDLFAYTAKADGKIITADDSGITVQYKDGTTESVQLGRRYGKVAGSTIPHDVVAAVKLGANVKQGEVISYNTGFFDLDPTNPKQVVWKAGVMVKTALMDITDTIEDSSTISERIGLKLTSSVTEPRTIILRFNQAVRNLAKPGTSVDADSILCTIEDPITADNDLFDEESLKTLRVISSQTPRAKIDGIVERVEVFYNGDIEDMSESLAAITRASDRQLARTAKATGGATAANGKVDESLRIAGKSLEFDQVALIVYVTTEVSAGVGDKGVFGNQLKTIFGRVMTGTNKTESGVDLDAIFGYQSISDRIVNSPEIMGTTNVLLELMSKNAAKIWRGK